MLVPTNRVRCDICKEEFHEDEFDWDEETYDNVCPYCGAKHCFIDLYEQEDFT